MHGNRTSSDLRWYLDYEMSFPTDIYHAFRAELVKEILSNPEGCTLPLNMGWIKILGFKSPVKKKKSITSDRPVKNWRKQYHTNLHTSGWVFKIRWYSKPVGAVEDQINKPFQMAEVYNFFPNEYFKEELYKKIMKGEWTEFHTKTLGFHNSIRVVNNNWEAGVRTTKKASILYSEELKLEENSKNRRNKNTANHNAAE